MGVMIDLSGRRFGRLLVLERKKKGDRAYYKCLCDCGVEKDICGTSLTGGITKSCGCYHRERLFEVFCTHKMTGTKELKAWYHMHERCYKRYDKKYPIYGGRGITVCDRWHKDNKEGFNNFLSDMGKKPSKRHTLHRIDNDKGYSPDNCKWATYEEQNNTRSNSVRVVIDGVPYTKKEAARVLGVSIGPFEYLQSEGYTLDSIVSYIRSGKRKNRNKNMLVKDKVNGKT